MDATDARILRMLYWSPFNPVDEERGPMGLWDIARALGVHGNTVKRRLAEMEDAGVLQGLSFFPNARHVGMEVTFASFRFPDAALCAAATDDVVARGYPGCTVRFTDELRVNVAVHTGGDLDAELQRLADRWGAARVQRIVDRYWDAPALTDLEMRVMQEMHKDMFASPPEIAARVGVTPKTTRKCIQSLREKQAFCVVPLVDHMRVQGLQTAIIDVTVEDRNVADRVFRSAPDLVPNGIYTAGHLSFTALTENGAEFARIVDALRMMEGVKEVQTRMPLALHWAPLPGGLQRVSEAIVGRRLEHVT